MKNVIFNMLPRAEGLLAGLKKGIELNEKDINKESVLNIISEAIALINESRAKLETNFYKEK